MLTAVQLMAQAEEHTGNPDAGPPKSGERPLDLRRPAASDAPVIVVPEATALPRFYDSGDDGDNGDLLDPTSLFGTAQSGSNMLLAAPVPTSPRTVAPAASEEAVPEAGAAAVVQVAPSHDAYLASFAPARPASGAAAVIAVCVVVTLGLAALYFVFLAA